MFLCSVVFCLVVIFKFVFWEMEEVIVIVAERGQLAVYLCKIEVE